MIARPRCWSFFALSLCALPAHADSECQVAVSVWELELTRVEAVAGTPDLNAVVAELGSRARLRGGYRDPARPTALRLELVGSTDGAGLQVTLEPAP